MKKILMVLLFSLLLAGCGKSEAKTTSATTLGEITEEASTDSNKFQIINGFEFADYEKYNSPASENGLGGTLIYVDGVVKTKVTAENVLAMVVNQEDGKSWVVSVTDRPEEDGHIVDELLEKNIRIFGVYQGYSSVYNMPAMAVADENGKIEVENEDGSFKEGFAFKEYYENRFGAESKKESSQKENSEIFADLKNSCLESVRNNATEDQEYLELAMKDLEDSYYSVKKCRDFSDAAENKNFARFVHAISYFTVYLEEESMGYIAGEYGWKAVQSLIESDGKFEENMGLLKDTYEHSGSFHLFENKYEAGQYKIGTDIPSGEYVFFAEDSSGYFSVTSDANGNDIIANENFSYNSIMSIYDGEYLELSRCYAVPITDVSKISKDKGTMFKIGVFLQPGEYKLIADSDSGYYCIYSDDRQDDIVSNDNFKGQSYVNVSDGQYLLLSRCHIETE